MSNAPFLRLTATLVVLLASAFPVRAQTGAGLALRILADDTHQPLADAQALVSGLGIGARTDSSGLVLLSPIPVGTHLVEISRLGYTTERLAVDFAVGQIAEGEVALLQAPVVLAGVNVQGRRVDRALSIAGFEERARTGQGSYLSGAELERRRAGTAFLSDLLRNMRGMTVIPMGSGHIVVSTRDAVTIMGQQRCQPPIYLNGIPTQTSDQDQLDSLVPTSDVAGIEVYAGAAELPSQYLSSCGAILIWTRTR
jgi:hypothetical protein